MHTTFTHSPDPGAGTGVWWWILRAFMQAFLPHQFVKLAPASQNCYQKPNWFLFLFSPLKICKYHC